MAIINIPSPLRKFSKNRSKATYGGDTVRQVMTNFASDNPEIVEHLFDQDGNLRKFMRVYIGDTDIKSLDNEDTVVDNDTVISIIPAIAGGTVNKQP